MKLTKQVLPAAIGLVLGAAWLVGQQTNSNAVLNTDIATPSAPASGHTLTYTKNGTACAESPSAMETCTGGTETIASGALSLATNSLSASGGCQAVTAGSVNSAAATGVVSTDTINWNPNGSIKGVTGYSPNAAQLQITPYPAPGYVNFDVCNPTSGAITPGSVTLNWRVVR
jgi:hypothetical protein